MEPVKISCSFNDEIFNAGEVVAALIRMSSYPSNALIFAQAIGIIHIDKRWAKVPQSNITNEDTSITNFLIPINLRPNFHSKTIFTTTWEPLSVSQICDEGVYLQFELPSDALPSFTGLAGIITYLIIISLQFPNDIIRSHFPFRVFGHGSHSSFSPHQHHLRHQSYPLCSFAASSRSYDSFISSLTSSVVSIANSSGTDYFAPSINNKDEEEHDGDVDNSHNPHSYKDISNDVMNKISFSICDVDSICLITFSGLDISNPPLPPPPPLSQSDPSPSPSSSSSSSTNLIGSIESGETIWVHLNFSSSKQICEMFKFKLIQRECHSDGTRLQEKIIDEHTRMTSIALNLLFPVRIPILTSPTFACPAFSVIYVIEIEFFPGLLKSASSRPGSHNLKTFQIEQKEPLLWSVEIKIIPPASSTGGRKCVIPHGSSSQFIDSKSIFVEEAV